MKPRLENRQIYVSARIWHEYEDKIHLAPFIEVLNDKIDLSDYGTGLQRFYFTFLMMNPDGYFEPVKIYNNKKHADISVEIPHKEIEYATKEEVIELMEEAYLKGIEKLKTIKRLHNFDVDAFKQDVEEIFSQEKWYEISEAA